MQFAYVVNGLAAGGGYALAGVGLSYTIGVSRILNFAFGSFYMLGVFLVAYFTGTALRMGYITAALLTLAMMLTLGYAFARVSVLPLIERSESAVMIATLAMSVLITYVALDIFGGDIRFVNSPFQNHVYSIGSARVTQQAIIALVSAPIVTAALVSFMRRTLLGARIRATANNPMLASASGINIRSANVIAVTIGVVLASLAGALYGPTTVVNVFSGNDILLKAFTVAALAGMGQLWGALVVGIATGIAESVFSGYVSPSYSAAFIFGLLLIALLFFPRGIFGSR